MASGNYGNRVITFEDGTNGLSKAVNKYSKELLNSIKNKSFTEENIKNMLLTNARILVLLRKMLSQLPNTTKLDELSKKINEVQTELKKTHENKIQNVETKIQNVQKKLNSQVNEYKKHKHTIKNITKGTNSVNSTAPV
jgi:methyltransferase-like protein